MPSPRTFLQQMRDFILVNPPTQIELLTGWAYKPNTKFDRLIPRPHKYFNRKILRIKQGHQ